MASKKTKKPARKGRGSSARAAKPKSRAAVKGKGKGSKSQPKGKKAVTKPGRSSASAKKSRAAAAKPKAKKPKKAAAKKPKKAAAKKPQPKAKAARKPKTAARSAKNAPTVRRVSALTSSTGKPRLPAAGKTPKASIRRPEGAEELKAKIGALASATSQIRGLKRTLNKSFYDIGQILGEIEAKRLYEVKGYGSFEAFVEREIDLGKQLSLRIVRIAGTFLKEAAVRAGLERVSAALHALEADDEAGGGGGGGSASTTSSGTRSAIPIHKQ